jgi:hypothetical protein
MAYKEKALIGKDGHICVGKQQAWYEFERRQYEKENDAAKEGIVLGANEAKKYFKCPLCNCTKTNKRIMPTELMGNYNPGPVKVKHVICCFDCYDVYEAAGVVTNEQT